MTTKTVDKLDQAIAATEAGSSTEPPRRFLSRQDILGADDIGREDVYCPEWGGWVIIRSMTGMERSRWDDALIANPEEVAAGAVPEADMTNYHARLVAMTAVDVDNHLLFAGPEDSQLLGDKNSAPLLRCYTVAARLSGLTPAAMRELTGTLGNVPSDGSGSGSPAS